MVIFHSYVKLPEGTVGGPLHRDFAQVATGEWHGWNSNDWDLPRPASSRAPRGFSRSPCVWPLRQGSQGSQGMPPMRWTPDKNPDRFRLGNPRNLRRGDESQPIRDTQFSFFHRIAHCTVYTPYCTLDTPHSTIHLTLHTLHLLDTTFHTWHCTLLTPCWVTDCMSLRTVHSTCFKRYCPPFSPCC